MKLEQGAAHMKMELRDGVITVTHCDPPHEVLWRAEAEVGTWGRIWDVLYNSVPLKREERDSECT